MVENETVGAEEDLEYTKQINEMLSVAEKAASKEAHRRVKKNQKEITRLNNWATQALISNHKERYIYAISKLRKMINKEVSDDILETLWKTSREQYEKIRDEGVNSV